MNKNANNIQSFIKYIKIIAIYLGQFTGEYTEPGSARRNNQAIDNITHYDGYILKQYMIHGIGPYYITYPNYLEFICIAGKNGNSNSVYVKHVIENIFPIWRISGVWGWQGEPYSYEALQYNSKICQFDTTIPRRYNGANEIFNGIFLDKPHLPCSWRDDIKFPDNLRRKVFEYSMERLSQKPFNVKAYWVFWNLFLLAIDDEIYNDQLSDVMSLAQKLGFTKAMMSDWCHAVEYVTAGNMLSENCDLQCETEEGKAFFLHKSNS